MNKPLDEEKLAELRKLKKSIDLLTNRMEKRESAQARDRRKSEEEAIKAGVLLLEAKRNANHGDWIPFLKEENIPQRTARYWMSIAESWNHSKSAIADLRTNPEQPVRLEPVQKHSQGSRPEKIVDLRTGITSLELSLKPIGELSRFIDEHIDELPIKILEAVEETAQNLINTIRKHQKARHPTLTVVGESK